MSYGTSFGITLPTVGATAWGGDLNEILQSIIDCLEAKVTPSGLNINGTVELNDNALIEILYGRFTNNAANVGTTRTCWFKGNDLFVTDGAGNVVQMTSGGSVNVAGSGGIGGDYASAGASVTYTAATSNYSFLTPASAYAQIDVGDVRIHKGSSANYVGLKSPTLSANWNITFPTGSVGSSYAQLVAIDNAGTMAHTLNPRVDTLTASLYVSGANGSWENRQERIQSYHAYELISLSGTSAGIVEGGYYQAGSNDSVQFLPIKGMTYGDRIKAVKVHYNGRGVAFQCGLHESHTGSQSRVAFFNSNEAFPSSSDEWKTGSLTASGLWGAGGGSGNHVLGVTLRQNRAYYLRIVGGSPASIQVSSVHVTWDRPSGSY